MVWARRERAGSGVDSRKNGRAARVAAAAARRVENVLTRVLRLYGSASTSARLVPLPLKQKIW
jgi:hypothetical protein